MASSSNPPDALGRIPDYEYLYVSNTNVSNFVSVKLYGACNYQLWKTQMMCLMKTHQMLGLVDEGSIDSSTKDTEKYDSLLKGWIFGSVSEDVLRVVVDSESSATAKDVWNTLKRYFNATRSSDDQQDSTLTKTDTNTDSKDKNVVLEEIPTNDKCGNSRESEAKGEATTQTKTEEPKISNQLSRKQTMAEIFAEEDINDKDISSADSEAKREDTTQPETKDSAPIEVDRKIERKAKNGKTEAKSSLPKEIADHLQEAIQDDDWDEVVSLLIWQRDAIKEQINSDDDGNTALHIAVGIGRNDVIRRVLISGRNDDLTVIRNSDGSTFLHIAAIVGNTDAAELLVKKDPNLLHTSDKNMKKPLDKAYENMQLHTIAYLLEAIEQDAKHQKIKKDAEAEKNKKHVKVEGKKKKTTKEASDGQGKSKEATADDQKGKKEPDDIGTGKEGPDDEKRNEEPDVDGKGIEEPDVDEKGDEEPDVDGNGDEDVVEKGYEEPDVVGKGHEQPDVDGKGHEHVKIGANVLVNAISAKDYEFASKLVARNSKYAVLNDEVLMAIARTFPSELGYVETLFYPSLGNLNKTIVKRTKYLFTFIISFLSSVKECLSSFLSCEHGFILPVTWLILAVPAAMVYWIFHLILLLLLMVYFPFFMLYFLFWKIAMRVVNIENKKEDYEEAKNVLKLLCEEIYKTDADRHELLYTGPILEAACQNAYDVVVEILKKWPKAIRCKDENGYDIIQLATIHRSEKIYNLIYMIGDRKTIYRTMTDSSKNNMLHLSGRLAPSKKLKLRTGAALQLQSELQWREEVKKLVFPSFATKENIFKDTPDVVFTKEHENLMKEAEIWIRIVAESCSITAALITTIVFAAAITVPGGMNQEKGIPVFKKEIAFTIFVVSDAISLVSSVTALLVFLSIVSARFAEQDFLLRLPRQMLIGLCTLFLSTAAMMVAFGATFFLVFTDHQLWMLAPICGLCFLPIAIYFHLQVPLIIDLFRSTYISMFTKPTVKLFQKP